LNLHGLYEHLWGKLKEVYVNNPKYLEELYFKNILGMKLPPFPSMCL
jgi:hypothetical protein